nr:MAG TPA: Envelope protein [Caudoviricetes sp.]
MKLNQKQKLQILKNVAIELPIEILHFIVVPIALLACDEKRESLPKWAAWFDENDYGINGDDGWKNEHFPNGKNRTYFARLCWLYRNRIGNFSAKYLGVKVEDIDASSVKSVGDTLATENKGAKSTECLVTCKMKDGKERFGYYREIRYGKSKRYCRIYLGWKLMDICGMNEENKSTYLEADDKKVLKSVWAVNPFKRVQNER